MDYWEDIPLFDIESDPLTAIFKSKKVVSSSLEITDKERERFLKNVVKSPRCWFWVGAISTPDGYGRFTWQRGNAQRTVLAHRFALESVGVLVDGIVAEHFCNEPLCVRVDRNHVFPSSQSENIRYAVSLGRHRGNQPTVMSRGSNPAERSLRIRSALKDGWDADEFLSAIDQPPQGQPTLF